MVGSTYPGAEEGAKGSAVRRLKCYASWVKTVRARSANQCEYANNANTTNKCNCVWRMNRFNPVSHRAPVVFSSMKKFSDPVPQMRDGRDQPHSRRRALEIEREKFTYIGEIPPRAGQHRGKCTCAR